MAALPVGMQLVNALDDVEFDGRGSIGNILATASDHMRYVLHVPLESDDAGLDVEMNIDMDVFCPSAMLDADAFSSNPGDVSFDSGFYPAVLSDDVREDVEQMLLCGNEEALLHNHDHDLTPGQRCQCRTFAITADRVQTQSQQVAVAIAAARDQKKVLQHTFGSGKRLQGFGFGEGAGINQVQYQDIKMTDERGSMTAANDVRAIVLERRQPVVTEKHPSTDAEMTQVLPEPVKANKQNDLLTPEHVLQDLCWIEGNPMFSSPLHRSQSLGAISSPLSSTCFVSLEDVVATPLSNMSRSAVHSKTPATVRSLSPADELEKMATSGSQLSIPKMNMLRGNFQVSPEHGTVSLVTPTAMLPPPYFRGALDSPEKRRAHSKTISSFAQSVSFSFSNDFSTDR
uniref:Uncharacterized protein n=1 Tax=Peronospora matthiolae TaxID=2874970 RepID=A0AAV1UUT6_9STRA